MSATANTTLTYPLTDFTTSSGVVNKAVLQQEMVDAGLSATHVATTDTECIITFSVLLDQADVLNADSVVAAHAGTGFGSTIQREIDESEDSDDTGAEVVKVTLNTGVMPAGNYSLDWYMELALTTSTGGSGSRGYLYVTKNGGTRTERARMVSGDNQWRNMSGGIPQVVNDGDQYVFELAFERIGSSGNAARARRARIGWSRLD